MCVCVYMNCIYIYTCIYTYMHMCIYMCIYIYDIKGSLFAAGPRVDVPESVAPPRYPLDFILSLYIYIYVCFYHFHDCIIMYIII